MVDLNAASNIFNNTSPTSTVFFCWNSQSTMLGDNILAYVFAEKKDFQKLESIQVMEM